MRLIVLFGLIIFMAAPQAARGDILSPTYVKPIMEWVEARTKVQVKTLPRVIVSRAAMVARIGNPLRQSALARALYVPGEVVIDDSFWDPDDVRAVSFLVHELVHHAQHARGVAYPCHKAKEWEAYRLQNLWLAEHGLPPIVNSRWITRMARCDSPSLFN